MRNPSRAGGCLEHCVHSQLPPIELEAEICICIIIKRQASSALPFYSQSGIGRPGFNKKKMKK